MIHFKAFKAIRPTKKYYPQIVTKPYDVMTYDEIYNESLNNNLSFFHIIRSEIDLGKDVNPYSKEVYEKAKKNFNSFLKNEYLIQEKKESIYVYKEKINGHSQIGFVGLVSTDDYKNEYILKHENTRADKEKDRITHIETLGAQTGSVFLFFKNQHKLRNILSDIQKKDPDIHFDGVDNVTHSLWVIDDEQSKEDIINEFKNVSKLYIADGHHRSASAVKIAEKYKNEPKYKNILSVIYPDDNLLILPYNRVIKDLNGNSIDKFFKKIEKYFIIEETKPNDKHDGFIPQKKNNIGIYIDKQWYILTPKQEILVDDPVKSLDVSLLQDYILSNILDIKDPKTNQRIDFIGGDKGSGYLKNLVDGKDYSIAFSLYPTSIEELMAVADANLLMPPKSTWFEPKIGSGIAIYSYK